MTLNQYAYTIGNPVFNVDPSSHLAMPIATAAAIFNTLLNGIVMGSFGYAAIKTFILKKGRQEAVRIFTRSICSKLISWGAPYLAVALGSIIETALNYFNIGLKIAQLVDSIDRYKNNQVVGW